MAETVYCLCALTSLVCAVLLLRGFWRTRARFLLWSSLCFIGLALNNGILFTDKVLLPTIDLMSPAARSLPALVGLACLLYGLIWDSE